MDSSHLEKFFPAGSIIMAQGEAGNCAYFIQSGRVAISVEKTNGCSMEMGSRGAGSIIGEMAIVDDQPRSATVRALTDCVLLVVSKEDFTRSVQSASPIVRLISQVILIRYRDILQRSGGLLEQPELSEQLEHHYAEHSAVLESIRMANEFKSAVRNKQLFLQYQPIVDLKSGRILGFEALMRWNHPQKGIIPPNDFIPMAEDSGLIVEASRWALREACLALRRMESQFEYGNDLFMSVNFSASDFEDESFIAHFDQILAETQTHPCKVHLEITERLLMKHPHNVRKILSYCREAGTGVAIDDFGTGYSSLSYLHQYPINTLKIDQSFIRNMGRDQVAMGLVKSILSLSENMGIKIIAEGVEELAEAEVLRSLNCDVAQGYYFARPMHELEARLLLEQLNLRDNLVS